MVDQQGAVVFEPEVAMEIPTMDISDAAKLLKIKAKEVSSDMVFEAFYKAATEKGLSSENRKNLILARNVFVRQFTLSQIETQGFFEVTSGYEIPCDVCHGTGELYKFKKSPVSVKCKACENGRVVIPCHSCKGTKKFRAGTKVVDCTRCMDPKTGESTGKMTVKCKFCHGTSRVKRPVLEPELLAVTPCKRCRENGFLYPRKQFNSPRVSE
jgi:hypothetical protein